MKTVTRIVSALLTVVYLAGCGAGSVKDGTDKGAAKAVLVDTTVYLPVQKYDEKKAVYLPYPAQPNPYEASKSRIDKEVVAKFIEAKRLAKNKQYAAVQILLDEIIVLDKNLSGPWVMKGDIALLENNAAAAREHYKKAILVNDKNVNAYIRLALQQRVAGQFIEAQNTYAAALKIWPDFPEAHLNVAVLYDVYLNHPLRAQKHMEAYRFLVEEPTAQSLAWLEEIQSRTGVTETTYKPACVAEQCP